MPGPAIIAAALVTTLVLTTDEPPKVLMTPDVKAICAERQCAVLTQEQLEQVYQQGVEKGIEATLKRMQASCLKDEA